MSRYRILVGWANWVVTLGRFDFNFTVSTMRRYNEYPLKGILGAILIIVGYLKHYTEFRIICKTRFLEVY